MLIRYIDHKGNEFKTFEEMCMYWNTDSDSVKTKLNMGYSLRAALTLKSCKGVICTDHKGNKFPTFQKMCRYWGIQPIIVVNRIKKGWSLGQALTTK